MLQAACIFPAANNTALHQQGAPSLLCRDLHPLTLVKVRVARLMTAGPMQGSSCSSCLEASLEGCHHML